MRPGISPESIFDECTEHIASEITEDAAPERIKKGLGANSDLPLPNYPADRIGVAVWLGCDS
jgi:hypothetical protein